MTVGSDRSPPRIAGGRRRRRAIVLIGGAVAVGVGLSLLVPGSDRAARADEVQYITNCSSDAGVRAALAAAVSPAHTGHPKMRPADLLRMRSSFASG